VSLASVPVCDTPLDDSVVHLDSNFEYRSSIPCRICANTAVPFDVVDLAKHCSQDEPYPDGFSGVSVAYHRCRICGAIFSPSFDGESQAKLPTSISDTRHRAIASDHETGVLGTAARHMLAMRRRYRNARVLAYGVGAYALADRLCQGGYRRVEAFDISSRAEKPVGTFDIVLAVDCIEHTLKPVEAVRDMCRYLEHDGCIVVEQELQPDDIHEVRGNWWYIAPRAGHVCMYSAPAMASLAQVCGLTFHEGETVHGFSRQAMSPLSRHVLSVIGKPSYFVPLLAPAVEALPSTFDWRCWSQGEVAGAGGFRWSHSGRLTWPLPEFHHLPATLRLMMPFCDRITPELLQGVHLYQGWLKTDFRLVGSNLVADIQVTKPMSHVYVDTPKPMTPRSVRGDPDDRSLGIAVLCRR